MNSGVDEYLIYGCGRCTLGGTPQCKVHKWNRELKALRAIVLDCGLTEEIKWNMPCYTFQKHNVLMMAAFKEYCSLSFFKGALLNDTNYILQQPGENSQAVRQLRFTDVKQIRKLESIIKTYVYEAIEVEKAGLKIKFKKNREPVPEELETKFREFPTLKTAFERLTPGRQRAYILFFSSAKQTKTREARIEKHIQQILKGKGLNDR